MKLHTRFAPVSVLVVPAMTLVMGCAEHAQAPKSPVATPCTNEASHELDEESVGVSTRPPIRRAPPEFEDTDPGAVRLFHDLLAPYGSWTDDPRLGLVWIPSREVVGSSFVPYGTHGHWTYREVAVRGSDVPVSEYVWVSDLPWGWATFHYGRWAYVGDGGWAWVAGRRYAGAWVDWRSSHPNNTGVIAWGPTPPSHVWRVLLGPRPTRALMLEMDAKDVHLVTIPYTAFATPYAYVRAHDLFAPDLGSKLLPAGAALAVAHGTDPAGAPSPSQLGLSHEVPAPPVMDRGLQQAWMLATPATASAVGAGPELGSPPRLRTWVAGGPRYAIIH